MSYETVTQVVYKCVCELEDCPGKGEPWVSRPGKGIPDRCRWCGRHTWNGHDKRTDRKGKKMLYVDRDATGEFEFEEVAPVAVPTRAAKIGAASKKPNGHGALGASPAPAARPSKKTGKVAIALPKPKRTRSLDAD